MIAYFILVHRYPQQFKRLFKSIFLTGNQYVVHIDKSSGPELHREINAFLEPYSGVSLIESKDAVWGGYSLVDAELRGMDLLLKMDKHWTHYINLSGQDFPLKSQQYIQQFFVLNPNRQFIRILNQGVERPDTMNRLRNIFIEDQGRITDTGVARPFLKGDVPFIGTQWKAVTRSFCEFVCHSPESERFKAFYKNSFIADESFFQTVLMNCGDWGAVVNDDLRMIDWIPDGDIKLRPRNFDASDIEQLKASRNLFARKFDANGDSAILELLERHLTSHLANIYLNVSPEPLSGTRRAALNSGSVVS